MGEYIYRIDPAISCLLLVCALFVVAEAGYWIVQKRVKKGSEIVKKDDVAVFLGAVLTLLTLLLGFTYSMSMNRYDVRRELAIDEANAIGTTYLRAQTLPEPWSSGAQDLLRRYTAFRVESAKLQTPSLEKIRELDAKSKEYHNALWTRAAALSKEFPSPISALYLETLNEMIDLHAKRLAAFQNRVPRTVYIVLWIVSAAAFFFGGLLSRTLQVSSASFDRNAGVVGGFGDVAHHGPGPACWRDHSDKPAEPD